MAGMKGRIRGLALVCLGLGSAAGYAQITETPQTVAPGHFLLKMDVVSVAVDQEAPGGGQYTGVGVARTFVSTGLTSNLDIQVGAELYLNQKFTSTGLADRSSGLSDLYFRTKWTFWRDEETYTEMAVLPYVKIPTGSDNSVSKAWEGGLIVPWATKLTGDFEARAMAQVDFLRNANDNGYDTNWYFSGAITREFLNRLGLYGEITAQKSSGGLPWAGMFGGGATVGLSDFFSWDFAIYRGLSTGAAKWNPVVRLNWRF
jgi:Putative MetA-pathway of phenol degradation